MNGFFAGGFLYNPDTREVLLHKRDGNTDINPYKWAFFGGLGEGDETPVEAFIREMKEELNIDLVPQEVALVCEYPNPERKTHRYSFYAISNKRKEEMTLGEGADFDWISLERVFNLDATQRTFDDLKTFIARV